MNGVTSCDVEEKAQERRAGPRGVALYSPELATFQDVYDFLELYYVLVNYFGFFFTGDSDYNSGRAIRLS